MDCEDRVFPVKAKLSTVNVNSGRSQKDKGKDKLWIVAERNSYKSL